MRTRLALLLVAGVMSVSLQAHAAPTIKVVAVDTARHAVVLTNSTLRYVSPTGKVVTAPVTCLQVEPLPGTLIIPAIHVPVNGTAFWAAAVSGTTRYFVGIFSIGPPRDNVVQAVFTMGVSNIKGGSSRCGVSSINHQAVGLAVIT